MGFGKRPNYAEMQAQAQAAAERKAKEKKRQQNQATLDRSRSYGVDAKDLFSTLLTNRDPVATGDTTLSAGSLLSLEGTLG